MSTAGKVLVVLVMLMMAGWMVLLSAVTQLNKNYGEVFAKNQKQLDDVTAEVAKVTEQIATTINKAHQEQADAIRDLREIQGRITAAERHQASTNASLARLKFQAALATAKTALETRIAEETQANEAKAAKLAEIEQAKARNADLRDQLGKLQDEFKQLLTENAKALGTSPRANPAGARVSRAVRSL
jgi:chromosome segregation ATPase